METDALIGNVVIVLMPHSKLFDGLRTWKIIVGMTGAVFIQ